MIDYCVLSEGPDEPVLLLYRKCVSIRKKSRMDYVASDHAASDHAASDHAASDHAAGDRVAE